MTDPTPHYHAFIVYAQAPGSHPARVLAFAQCLRDHGINVELDQFYQNTLVEWPIWCEGQLTRRPYDYVLVVCTAAYKQRFDTPEQTDARGVPWEARFIRNEIYNDPENRNRRFVPVLLDGEPNTSVPTLLQGVQTFSVDAFEFADPGYESLYRLITHQDKAPPHPVGPRVQLTSANVATDTQAAGSPSGDRLDRESARRYLLALRTSIERKAQLYAPLRGFASAQSTRAPSPLLDAWEGDREFVHLTRRLAGRETDDEAGSPHQSYDDILVAFDEAKRAVLLGAPGAGKSTTLRKLAVQLIDRAIEDDEAPIPVLITLGDWTASNSFADFARGVVAQFEPEAASLIDTNNIVLLLDGLNEIPTQQRSEKIGDLKQLIGVRGDTAQTILSCRVEDYVDDTVLGLDTLTLEPLAPAQIRDVLERWLDRPDAEPGLANRLFWQLAGDEALEAVYSQWRDAGEDEDTFWTVSDPREAERAYNVTSGADDVLWRQHIGNPRNLLRIAGNPFMLTMLFQVWASADYALPSNRGELFNLFVDGLLAREGLVDTSDDEGALTEDGHALLRGLGDLAWAMQTQQTQDQGDEAPDFGVLTVLPRATATDCFQDESLVKKAEDATLIEGTDDIRFRHQLLQEYFTARGLRSKLTDPACAATRFWPPDHWWERSGWEESTVLLAGLHADDCGPVIDWLANAQPEVAAQCIVESGARLQNQAEVFARLSDSWNARFADDELPHARAAVGRALGRLNLDRRTGIALNAEGLPDIDWVPISGGRFQYQDGKRATDPFEISRYPITNAQFQAFVAAENGYNNDQWWVAFSEPDRGAIAPSWNISNHPRETVSWWEAMAFCHWLSAQTGDDVRLPTEWEWERAARGKRGRLYPWGNSWKDNFANTWESSIGRTTAVGTYSSDVSSDRVFDFAGNVWEWCLNEYGEPENCQLAGKGSRVLRGGSWFSRRGLARACYRGGGHPNGRYDLVGFRVVRVSPSD
ncbi:MAG: SUMF1/EgtB/PvdO family nonheme iron enzyme [Pseudomonadota bacterium]